MNHGTLSEAQHRAAWFEQVAEPPSALAGYMISEHACAMLIDIEASFCAGAWVSVIVSCVSAIEAQLRDVEFPGERASLATLLARAQVDARFHRLRRTRNRLVHFDERAPPLRVETNLEAEAREAVQLTFELLWANPHI